jgi:hypothetical protein
MPPAEYQVMRRPNIVIAHLTVTSNDVTSKTIYSGIRTTVEAAERSFFTSRYNSLTATANFNVRLTLLHRMMWKGISEWNRVGSKSNYLNFARRKGPSGTHFNEYWRHQHYEYQVNEFGKAWYEYLATGGPPILLLLTSYYQQPRGGHVNVCIVPV